MEFWLGFATATSVWLVAIFVGMIAVGVYAQRDRRAREAQILAGVQAGLATSGKGRGPQFWEGTGPPGQPN